MKKKQKNRVSLSTTVPMWVKEEISSQVESGRYKSSSDFIRKAIFELLEGKKKEGSDIIKGRNLKRFIEKIS
jgi:Arc/MetJ-type ribon-helix-helix transcriptional regulator